MSEETENSTPNEEKPVAPKPPAKKPTPPRPAGGNPFLGKSGNFNKAKAPNPCFKGKVFKGSGVKKGK